MAARRGAGGCFHLTQQRIHLGGIHPTPGANAAMAGKPGNRRIQLTLQGRAFRIHRHQVAAC